MPSPLRKRKDPIENFLATVLIPLLLHYVSFTNFFSLYVTQTLLYTPTEVVYITMHFLC